MSSHQIDPTLTLTHPIIYTPTLALNDSYIGLLCLLWPFGNRTWAYHA